MLRSRKSALKAFLNAYPEYKTTAVLDKLRKKEYGRLDKEGHVYLDYTGGNLYAESQLDKHFKLLRKHTFGNPHSTNPSSQFATRLVEETRAHVLNYFNAGDDYYCIFTANASASLKIVGECYPFGTDSYLLLSLDNHNSVNGIREFARNKGGDFAYVHLDASSLHLNQDELHRALEGHADKTHKLFAFPAQSNVSGIKHPLQYIEKAHQNGWDVLLDSAAFVPSNTLDLQVVKPDFATVSFYKIFGYPTGLGCLLMRKEKMHKLVKPWFAGGTVSLTSVNFPGHFLLNNHERFEEGTVNYLDIPAIKIGLEHIEKIGIGTIQTRVRCLTGWLIGALNSLQHANGNPVLHLYGSTDLNQRGGTLVMTFLDQESRIIPFRDIEAESNKRKISLRTGCFCNPGIDETNYQVGEDELEGYYRSHEEGNFFDMMAVTGKLRGAIRVSVGLASNFADVYTFYEFAKSFQK